MAEASITTTPAPAPPAPPAQQEQEMCIINKKKKQALSVPMAMRTLQTAWRRTVTLAPRITQRLAEAYDRVLSIEHVRQIRLIIIIALDLVGSSCSAHILTL
jgi:hypothetical protein